jgi:hypothetical protein
VPARPAPYASDPVLVHRLVGLLRASFGPRLTATPLRFAMTSPPSGCQGDARPRGVEHARHTQKERGPKSALFIKGRTLMRLPKMSAAGPPREPAQRRLKVTSSRQRRRR